MDIPKQSFKHSLISCTHAP